jgi:hypothetical protein
MITLLWRLQHIVAEPKPSGVLAQSRQVWRNFVAARPLFCYKGTHQWFVAANVSSTTKDYAMFVKQIVITFAGALALACVAHADTAAAAHSGRHAHKGAHHRAEHRASARHDENSGPPVRGMSMAQIEKRYGAPLAKLPAAGGDSPRHPPINRWQYDGYTVYFERDRVITSVMDSAAQQP